MRPFERVVNHFPAQGTAIYFRLRGRIKLLIQLPQPPAGHARIASCPIRLKSMCGEPVSLDGSPAGYTLEVEGRNIIPIPLKQHRTLLTAMLPALSPWSKIFMADYAGVEVWDRLGLFVRIRISPLILRVVVGFAKPLTVHNLFTSLNGASWTAIVTAIPRLGKG